MNKRMTTGPREALELLYQAHGLVRGPLRTAIETAIDIGENGHRSDLTNMAYDRLRPGQKLTDPKRPGLVMRCGSQNGRYWVFRTTEALSLRQVEIPMGNYPDLGISEAREMWRQLRDLRKTDAQLTRLEDGRSKPMHADELLKKDPPASRMTVGELCHRFITEYAEKVKRSWAEDNRLLKRHVLTRHSDTAVVDFDAGSITLLVHGLHDDAPREAEKLLACLSTMFNVAKGKTKKIKITKPWLPEDVPNPMQSVPSLPKRDVQSYTPPASELQVYAGNLHKLPDPFGDALLFQLQTCARIGEAAEVPWSEIDLEAPVWTLAAERSKNGLQHKIMLSDQSVALLRRRKEAQPDAPFVFPSPKFDGEPIARNTAIRQVAKHRAELGVDLKFTPHAVRHGLLTWMAENQMPKELRDRVSNHRPPATAADSIYTKAAELNQPARIALQRWADFLDSAKADTVVSIGGVA